AEADVRQPNHDVKDVGPVAAAHGEPAIDVGKRLPRLTADVERLVVGDAAGRKDVAPRLDHVGEEGFQFTTDDHGLLRRDHADLDEQLGIREARFDAGAAGKVLAT